MAPTCACVCVCVCVCVRVYVYVCMIVGALWHPPARTCVRALMCMIVYDCV